MSTRRATHDDLTRRVYLDLRKLARETNRPTDEIIRLYALESLVERITRSHHAEHLVLKGGVLLAAFGARRPTRDIDLAGRQLDGDAQSVLAVVQELAALPIADGVHFDGDSATAQTIRDADRYAGVRVTVTGRLATARLALNVDVSIGDPMTPAARLTHLPRLLGGTLLARCYPLTMVLAEKLVTAMERGTVSTRWRDFVDIAALARTQAVSSDELLESMRAVALHRGVALRQLADVLRGYAELAQPRWVAWRRKQRLEDRTPPDFSELLGGVIAFADPIVRGDRGLGWDPRGRRWV